MRQHDKQQFIDLKYEGSNSPSAGIITVKLTSLNESFTLTKFTALLLAKVSYSTSTCLCSLGGMTKLDLLLLLDANS